MLGLGVLATYNIWNFIRCNFKQFIMKKLFLFLVLFCTISCSFKEPKPIERYQDKGYVLIEEPGRWNNSKLLLKLKNKDTIIEVAVPPFDALNLKLGDTLKSKR